MKKEIAQLIKDESLRKDLHVHTAYCDGCGTPDEIVQAAIAKGLDVIGFSGHGHMPFDEEMCMSLEATEAYESDVRAAAEQYGDQIIVLCGVEQDYFSDQPVDRWDYVIGSVHFVAVPLAETDHGADLPCPVRGGVAYPSVDDTTAIFEDAIDRFFGGDVYAFAEKYYETLADVVTQIGADIIGHFDLFSKFNAGRENNGKGKYFDENHPRYVAAWQRAADALLQTGALFEINYGAMNKKKRTEPYPSRPILEYLQARGARFIKSSDSHGPETVGAGLFSDK